MFEVIQQTEGADRLLRATGEMDVVEVQPLLPRVPALVAGASSLLLDITEVTFFDSSAARLVDRLARECGSAGVSFRVVAPPGNQGRRVLEIVGMAEALVVDDVTAGWAAVKPD